MYEGVLVGRAYEDNDGYHRENWQEGIMSVTRRSIARGCLLVLVVMLPLTGGSAQEQPHVNAEDGVAIKGYDSVAYFTDGRATEGTSEFEYKWDNVRWRFANATHRDEFAADPERYAPQYGGFCA